MSTDELFLLLGSKILEIGKLLKVTDLRVDSFANNNEVHVIHEPSGIKIGGISFAGTLNAGTDFNVIPIKTGVDSLLSLLSDVSDNRHVLEQLASTDFSSLYIPLALEIIRQGTVPQKL